MHWGGIIFVSTECLFFLLSFIFFIFSLDIDIPSDNLYEREKINKNEKSYVMYHQWSDDTTPACVFIDHLLFFSSRLDGVFSHDRERNNIFSSLVKCRGPFPIDEIPSHLHMTRRDVETYHIIPENREWHRVKIALKLIDLMRWGWILPHNLWLVRSGARRTSMNLEQQQIYFVVKNSLWVKFSGEIIRM